MLYVLEGALVRALGRTFLRSALRAHPFPDFVPPRRVPSEHKTRKRKWKDQCESSGSASAQQTNTSPAHREAKRSKHQTNKKDRRYESRSPAQLRAQLRAVAAICLRVLRRASAEQRKTEADANNNAALRTTTKERSQITKITKGKKAREKAEGQGKWEGAESLAS